MANDSIHDKKNKIDSTKTETSVDASPKESVQSESKEDAKKVEKKTTVEQEKSLLDKLKSIVQSKVASIAQKNESLPQANKADSGKSVDLTEKEEKLPAKTKSKAPTSGATPQNQAAAKAVEPAWKNSYFNRYVTLDFENPNLASSPLRTLRGEGESADNLQATLLPEENLSSLSAEQLQALLAKIQKNRALEQSGSILEKWRTAFAKQQMTADAILQKKQHLEKIMKHRQQVISRLKGLKKPIWVHSPTVEQAMIAEMDVDGIIQKPLEGDEDWIEAYLSNVTEKTEQLLSLLNRVLRSKRMT
jgi:hypothetical protein